MVLRGEDINIFSLGIKRWDIPSTKRQTFEPKGGK